MKNYKVISIGKAETVELPMGDETPAFHAFLDSRESDDLVIVTITEGDLKAGRKTISLNEQGYTKRQPFEHYKPGVHGPAELQAS